MLIVARFQLLVYLLNFENSPCFPGRLPAIFILIVPLLVSLKGQQVIKLLGAALGFVRTCAVRYTCWFEIAHSPHVCFLFGNRIFTYLYDFPCNIIKINCYILSNCGFHFTWLSYRIVDFCFTLFSLACQVSIRFTFDISLFIIV